MYTETTGRRNTHNCMATKNKKLFSMAVAEVIYESEQDY